MKGTEQRFGVLPFLLVFALFLFPFYSCDSSGGGDAVEVPAPVTSKDLQGTWFTVFSEPYVYSTGESKTADAWFFDFSGSAFELIFYKDSAQVAGNRGTFAVSGTDLILTMSQEWDETQFWVSKSFTAGAAFSLAADTLYVEGPGGPTTLKKTTFSRPAAMVKAWRRDPGITLTLNADGTYEYLDAVKAESENGDFWGVTGTAAGYLRAASTTRDGNPWIVGFLIPYTLSGGLLTLTNPDGPQEYR